VHDQRRDIDLGDVAPEVREPGWLVGDRGVEGRTRGDRLANVDDLLADPTAEVLIEIVEVLVETGEEGETVGRHGLQ